MSVDQGKTGSDRPPAKTALLTHFRRAYDGYRRAFVPYEHSLSPCLGGVLSSEHVERRLAAILAADVAGSCRLIGIDEEGTLARLKALRTTLFDPKITDHRGRIVKNTGDGALVEFGSVVDAVRCAVEIQHCISAQNTDVPQDKRIEFRIGIHVGDIIIEDNDIFGDGVNIAVRLEGTANRVVSVFPTTFTGRFGVRSTSPSKIWASRCCRSKT
jgi:class 3 adenylate cyclase